MGKMTSKEHGARDLGGPFDRRVDILTPLSARARLISALFWMGALGLIPWILYLSVTLPPKYRAEHWRLLWVGFDVGLLGVLCFAGWAAWSRRQVLAPASLVVGTLLVCDAWFDVVTSFGHRNDIVSMVMGFGVELPLAIFFFWLYRRMVMNTLATVHHHLGDRPPAKHLREERFFDSLHHEGHDSREVTD